MTILESIALGLIQGLTEFLPISSSGHLILARQLLHLPLENSIAFDVFLNTATLLAVVFCFWGTLRALARDLLTEGFSSRSKNLIWAIIVGTIPAALVGFFYADQIENLFRSPASVAWALIGGSILMLMADNSKSLFGRSENHGITMKKGFLVGVFQSLALIPGFSRSGATISGGILAGLSREEAIKFSFLLLIPISLGALIKILLDFHAQNLSIIQSFNLELILAFFAALFSGISAIRFLVRYLAHHSFKPFIIYRLIIAIIILIFF